MPRVRAGSYAGAVTDSRATPTGPDQTTAHRRDDGELVGWIRPDGDHWAAIDLLGREVAASVDWLDAEAALEERGLGYLADVWMLERGGGAVRVRMVEVTPARIVVKVDDFGDVSHATERIVLPWPIPAQLRAPRPGDPDGFTYANLGEGPSHTEGAL